MQPLEADKPLLAMVPGIFRVALYKLVQCREFCHRFYHQKASTALVSSLNSSAKMFRTAALTAFTLAAVVLGQQIGTLTMETHPVLSIQQCTASGCTTQQKSVVLDSNWRWTHSTAGATVSQLRFKPTTSSSFLDRLELLHRKRLGSVSVPRPHYLRYQLRRRRC